MKSKQYHSSEEEVGDTLDRILVFDDVLPFRLRQRMYGRTIKANYKIGLNDTSILEHREKAFMYCALDKDGIKDFEVLKFAKRKIPQLFKKIGPRAPNRVVINCGTPADSYLPHSHPDEDVLLYYINMEWKPEWHGETSFYSEDLRDIVFTSQFVPGRIIWFDGSIPHSIKPNDGNGPKFRFTLSAFYEK